MVSFLFNLHKTFNYIARIPRTRGFGVQSPTVYSFLRHGLNERAFVREHENLPSDYFSSSKLERLTFRIKSYLPSARIRMFDASELSSIVNDELSLQTKDTDVFVISNIRFDTASLLLWQQLVSDNRTVVTLDLFDCGLVFFDKRTFKQHFKVNY